MTTTQIIDHDFMNSIGNAVFILQPDDTGRPVYIAVNDVWCVAAKRRREDIIGKTAVEIFEGRPGTQAYAHHLRALSDPQKVSYDLLLPLGDGIHTVRTTLVPTFRADGELEHVVGTAIDITTELDDFIYLAAHDLRAPLLNVSALADMLLDASEGLNTEQSDLVGMIKSVSQKATTLIDEVLSHAQATAAVQPDETFDLVVLCRDIFAALDPWNRHRLTVGTHHVHTDRVATQIVLRNLFDNAIKHCGRDQITFSLDLHSVDDEMIALELTDNGKGFADPAVAFLRGGALRVDSGFGLHGIRRLINARGGQIEVSNLPEAGGSVIRFTLPGKRVD